MAAQAPRTVRDIARRHFIALRPDSPTPDAEQAMRVARIRALPVVRNDRLVRVTELRELLRRRLAECLGLAAAPDPCDPQRSEIAPDASLAEAAARLCEIHTGFLSVVENGHLVGLVTELDLLRAALDRAR